MFTARVGFSFGIGSIGCAVAGSAAGAAVTTVMHQAQSGKPFNPVNFAYETILGGAIGFVGGHAFAAAAKAFAPVAARIISAIKKGPSRPSASAITNTTSALGNTLSSITQPILGVAKTMASSVRSLISRIPKVTAADEPSLFRGVASDHPGYENALLGNATPRGGPATAWQHNQGETRSEFTSWTTNRSVAEDMSYPGGVVMRIPRSSVADRIVQSPDEFDEFEVLVRGPIIGAEVLR